MTDRPGFRRALRRLLVPRELRADGIARAIELVDEIAATEPTPPAPGPFDRADDDAPLFVLSAGWRSGSSLLQRMLSSDGRSLVWGEPYGDWAPIPRLAATVASLARTPGRTRRHAFEAVRRASAAPSDPTWLLRAHVANLHPGVAHLRATHRRFVDDLLGAPARQRGFERWGAKWVRLSAHHGLYLRWLYPRARFVLLVRHPLDALRSYQGRAPNGWTIIEPRVRIGGPARFLAHWANIVESFLDLGDRLGARLIRYEELIDRRSDAVERIERHAGVTIDRSVLDARVDASPRKPVLSLRAAAAFEAVAADVCRRVGYPRRS